MSQTLPTPAYVGSEKLFVLHPIGDTRLSKASGTQYYMLSLSPVDQDNRYCLAMNPSEEGLSIPETQIIKKDDDYCFPSTSLPPG